MRAVVQRVSRACVQVDGRVIGAIGAGLVALVGVEKGDGPTDLQYVADKLRNLRVFEDDQRKMNRSVLDVGGALLVVSQFTLSGDARNGRRPSFIDAEAPQVARPLYEDLVRELRAAGLRVETGEFQATMQVELVNDGPVTILLDSRKRF